MDLAFVLSPVTDMANSTIPFLAIFSIFRSVTDRRASSDDLR